MPKRVDHAVRREEILDAAVRVFARKGFPASRVEDVAAEAGIAKGSVYLYFDSRDALLKAAFDAYAERAAAALSPSGEGPALGQLERMLRKAVDMLAAHPDHAKVMLDMWAASGLPGMTSEPSRDVSSGLPLDMAAVYREIRQVVVALLRQAQDEGDVRAGVGEGHATVIIAAVEGCLLQWLVDPRVPLADLAAPIVDVCLNGIRG